MNMLKGREAEVRETRREKTELGKPPDHKISEKPYSIKPKHP